MRTTAGTAIPATKAALDLIQKHGGAEILLKRLESKLLQEYSLKGVILKRFHKRFGGAPVLKTAAAIYVAGDPFKFGFPVYGDYPAIFRGKLFVCPMAEAGLTYDNDSVPNHMFEELLNGPLQLTLNWYLILSHLYYCHGKTVAPDNVYDELCRQLRENWKEAQGLHHSEYLDYTALQGDTGFHLGENVPAIVKSNALQILKREVILE